MFTLLKQKVLSTLPHRLDHRTKCRGGHRPGGLHHQKAEAGRQRVRQAGHDLQRGVPALLLHALHRGLREHQFRRHQHPLHHRVSPFCLRTPAHAFPTVVFGYFGAWEQFRPPGVGARVTNEQHSGVYGESHCHLYSYRQDRHAAMSAPRQLLSRCYI